MSSNQRQTKKFKVLIHSLPLDCWSHILLFIESQELFFSVIRTVKHLYKHVKVQNPWCVRNIHFLSNLNGMLPSHVVNYVHSMSLETPLAIDDFLETNQSFNLSQIFTRVCHVFPNLESFYFFVSQLSPYTIAPNCRSTLRFTHLPISNLRPKLPVNLRLKVLTVRTTRVNISITEHFPNLETLFLINVGYHPKPGVVIFPANKYFVSSRLLAANWNNMPKLKEVGLTGLKFPKVIFTNLRKSSIIDVSIYRCQILTSKDTPDDLFDFSNDPEEKEEESFQNLKSLTLSQGAVFKARNNMISHLNKLEVLNFTAHEAIIWKGIEVLNRIISFRISHISDLPNLKFIEILGHFEYFGPLRLRRLPNLEELYVNAFRGQIELEKGAARSLRNVELENVHRVLLTGEEADVQSECFSKVEVFKISRTESSPLFQGTLLRNGISIKKLKLGNAMRTEMAESIMMLEISGDKNHAENNDAFFLPSLEKFTLYGCGLRIVGCKELKYVKFVVSYSCWMNETTKRRHLEVRKCANLEDIVVKFGDWYNCMEHQIEMEFEDLPAWKRLFFVGMLVETIRSIKTKGTIPLRYLEVDMGQIDGFTLDDMDENEEIEFPLRNRMIVDGELFPDLEVLVVNDQKGDPEGRTEIVGTGQGGAGRLLRDEDLISRLRGLRRLRKLKKMRITGSFHLSCALFGSVIGMNEEDLDRVIVVADLQGGSPMDRGRNVFDGIQERESAEIGDNLEGKWVGSLAEYLNFVENKASPGGVRIKICDELVDGMED